MSGKSQNQSPFFIFFKDSKYNYSDIRANVSSVREKKSAENKIEINWQINRTKPNQTKPKIDLNLVCLLVDNFSEKSKLLEQIRKRNCSNENNF